MNKYLLATLGAVALAGGSSISLAGGRHQGDGYYDYAPVLRATPLTEVVRVKEPREVCWTEHVTHTRPRRHHGSVTPEIVGGIIGGVVGNQFGSGRGKDIATVAGAVLGGSLAHDMKRRRGRVYDSYTEPVERCRLEHDYYEQERVVGYDVKYRYNGQIYRARMERDPGDSVRVRVNVQVAE